MWNSHNINKVTLFHLVITGGMVIWALVISGLYWWAAAGEQIHLNEMIKLRTESLAENTQALRSWIGEHGGIYVEVDDTLQPHPLLSGVSERDVETPSGRKLTLLNSQEVLRHISNDFESDVGDRIRLVSNHPINPTNTPDDWEKAALNKLKAGAAKIQEMTSDNEESLFRMMFPMRLEPRCLNCHRYLTEEPQQVVGGLSVAVDKAPYDRLSGETLVKMRLRYLGIWMMGLWALALFDYKGSVMLKEIERTATHDGLTGLNNRRQIEHLLIQECERADRYGGSLSIMMLDIDHFKKVNDTYGHQVGDEALRVVSDTVKEAIRKTDMAGRYGGEEILVLAPGTTCEGAKTLAERLNAAIKAAPIKLKNGKVISVTVSIGVATFMPERKSVDSLVKAADDALYKAKEAGRDRVCCAD